MSLQPVTEAASLCIPHSHLHRLVPEGSGNQDASPRCSGKALPGMVDTTPLAGKVPGCLEPETGPVPEAVLLRPVTEAVSFCNPHSHLCRLVSVGSGNQDVSHRCSLHSTPIYTVGFQVPAPERNMLWGLIWVLKSSQIVTSAVMDMYVPGGRGENGHDLHPS